MGNETLIRKDLEAVKERAKGQTTNRPMFGQPTDPVDMTLRRLESTIKALPDTFKYLDPFRRESGEEDHTPELRLAALHLAHESVEIRRLFLEEHVKPYSNLGMDWTGYGWGREIPSSPILKAMDADTAPYFLGAILGEDGKSESQTIIKNFIDFASDFRPGYGKSNSTSGAPSLGRDSYSSGYARILKDVFTPKGARKAFFEIFDTEESRVWALTKLRSHQYSKKTVAIQKDRFKILKNVYDDSPENKITGGFSIDWMQDKKILQFVNASERPTCAASFFMLTPDLESAQRLYENREALNELILDETLPDTAYAMFADEDAGLSVWYLYHGTDSDKELLETIKRIYAGSIRVPLSTLIELVENPEAYQDTPIEWVMSLAGNDSDGREAPDKIQKAKLGSIMHIAGKKVIWQAVSVRVTPSGKSFTALKLRQPSDSIHCMLPVGQDRNGKWVTLPVEMISDEVATAPVFSDIYK